MIIMNNDVSNQNPENFDGTYTNDPIYLLARYKAYVDLFEDDKSLNFDRIKEIKFSTFFSRRVNKTTKQIK